MPSLLYTDYVLSAACITLQYPDFARNVRVHIIAAADSATRVSSFLRPPGNWQRNAH